MISICIPIYNFSVTDLANSLHTQCLALQIPFEILLIDDASYSIFKNENAALAQLNHVVYKDLNENIGRASIRNRLASIAQYNFILFMDCDSELCDPNFIKNYVQEIGSTTDVVCGGRIYPNKPVDKSLLLHWKYGSQIESKTAPERQLHPYHSFMTNNFMIRKDIFKTIEFNENLKGYGHEDTLFGMELANKHYAIQHINNPVRHIQLESTEEFIDKTYHSIQNLIYIYKISPQIKEYAKLLRITITNANTLRIISLLLKPFEFILTTYYKRNGHSLFLFQLYKAIILIRTHASYCRNIN